MSSQDNQGIALWHQPSTVGHKLLELPPELLSILEGENPPTLTLESSPTVAVLKAAGKKYSLRQKNTSNALILLLPTYAPPASSEIPELGLGAVATLHETIELVPEAGNGPPAAATKGKWHEKFGRNR
ncbi:hypothetical protein QBC33DRAFT_524120 [Phialemonium atrogriseum]|uniref:Sister chromatid cohesion protein DCC1 n=1 Tax=Phialemonium atrogriseum TaxID=1093897 RepID=A0AAJ0C9U4_9PEZI|nr:uncharacterized protein QBC33DRAFT_524120 [Phialemonium atrogriseum]KAK1771588.1 hypothetical protein QBC33DRAFT_524120 [Phialemonium atrogriseum]